jgi:uncharacterized OB-fold protein
MMSERLVKPIPDRDTVDYWQALADGKLVTTHCHDCGQWSWPPRPICSKCHGENLALDEVKGTGTVYSWIVVHRSTTPDMMKYAPYTLALVRLDEQADIYIPGRLITDMDVQRGMKVRVVPEKITEQLGDLAWTTEGLPT